MAEAIPELAGCLARVRKRDEQAARDLVEKLHPLVIRIVRAHLPQGEDEQDLAQDVFLKLFDRLEQYLGQVPFEHWVSRIAVNTCIDKLRSRQRRPSVCWSDLSDDQQRVVDQLPTERSEDTPPERLAWEVVEKLMLGLAPKERLLISWLDLEQRSIAEVCEQTGWNSGVVRIRAFRARRKLKSLFEALEQSTTKRAP